MDILRSVRFFAGMGTEGEQDGNIAASPKSPAADARRFSPRLAGRL